MPKPTTNYFNRELSWLEFNQRVLGEAQSVEIPVLERLKFLAITASNLDEFFMVRVGGLQILSDRGVSKPDPSGLTPDEQLEAISARTHSIIRETYTCYLDEVEPELNRKSLKRVRPGELNERQARILEEVFDDEISAILTPMAVTSSDDFPMLINQTLNVCVRLDPESAETPDPRFAIIPFGRTGYRFVTLPAEGGYEYMLLEDVVGMFIQRFFPGESIVESVPFRITRNADLSIREDQAADILEELTEILDARKESDCVRLEIAEHATPELLVFLRDTLHVRPEAIYSIPGPLDLAAFMQLTDLRGFDELRFESWPPKPSSMIPPQSKLFDVIATGDLLLYHPYESFEPVVRLIEEAAEDPDVLAIKQTLYRTSRNSPIIAAMIRAAERGKYVSALVELKARFDEARNIEWARHLEQAGVQVIYGVKGLKTHSKICIIIRREPHGIQRYVHFGTGNYNESTARLYSDVSFMTCNEELGADATSFFNAVSGYSQPQRFRKLEMAPIGMRDKLLEMIEVETQRKLQGQRARIVAKMNSLVDPAIIDALYDASKAGVRVRLNVRGICCLRPGVPGLSENITVISIVDRFLEHSRIFYFYHGGDERVFISSADWMPRNLDRRIELLVPVEDKDNRDRLKSILQLYFRDTVKSRRLKPGGSYERVLPADGEAPVRSQEVLYQQVCDAVRQAESSQRTVFVPHRAPGADY